MDPTPPNKDGDLSPKQLAEQERVILAFERQLHSKLVARARRLIRDYHMDPAGLDAEGAVNAALLALLQAVKSGKLHRIATRADFERAFTLSLDHVLLDERKRQRRRRRGGSSKAGAGQTAASAPLDADLDAVDPRAIPPDEQVASMEQVEWDLNLLERHD
jgi:hypothetical protein